MDLLKIFHQATTFNLHDFNCLISFGSVCSDGKNEDLLHEVILIVGYFTVLNYDNQVKLI